MLKLCATWSIFGLAFVGASCGPSDPVGPDAKQPTNRAPLIASFGLTAPHDLEYDVVVPVSDPDGDAVTLTAEILPGWMDFDPASGRLFGVPGEQNIGTGQVRIAASDGTLTARRTENIQVTVGTSTLAFDGPWVAPTQHRFGHDGAPFASQRFVVYNDYSAPGTKEWVSQMLEQQLDSLGARLGVLSDDEYEFDPTGKLHVYADKLQGDAALGYSSTVNGWAYRDGFIVMAPDAPRYATLGYYEERYRALAMHELMHDVEFLLIGRDRPTNITMAWFREGIASYMPGLAPGAVAVDSPTLQSMASWRAAHSTVSGGGNPIGIDLFTDIPVANTGSYYLWFAQGIRYLVDDQGFGLGESGLRGFFEDLRAGKTFRESFAERTGVTVEEFEQTFWERMEAFLPAN